MKESAISKLVIPKLLILYLKKFFLAVADKLPTKANLNYFFTAECSHMDDNKQSTECRGFFSKTLDFVLLEIGESAQ